MSELINAADAIRASIRQYKALSEFADSLEKIGQLEQQAVEIQARIKGHKADEAIAKEAANRAKTEHAKAEAAADSTRTTALAEAENIIQTAKEQATYIKKLAARQIKEQTSKANAAVEAREAEAASKIAGIEEQLTELTARTNEVVAAKAVAERELAEILAKREEVKNQLASVLNT